MPDPMGGGRGSSLKLQPLSHTEMQSSHRVHTGHTEGAHGRDGAGVSLTERLGSPLLLRLSDLIIQLHQILTIITFEAVSVNQFPIDLCFRFYF